MKYREINIENGKWSSRHDLEEHIPFCFLPDASDNISVELKGVTLGNLEEKMSIPVKAVRHDFMQQDGHRIDTSSVIPFGSEPFIARKFEYFGHVIKVTSDIRVKAPVNGNFYSVDELVLKGKFKRFSVIDKKMGPAINWGKIPSEDSVIYESEDLFGVILFESERGTQLEIGTGFDVWRWNISEQLEDLKGKLQIELKDGQIIIRRFIMYSDAEFEIPKRDWRFSWYLSWSSEKKLYEKVPENSNIRDINDFDWIESGKSVLNDKYYDTPCFQSKPSRNILRKWLRSEMNNIEGGGLFLSGIEPKLCDNPSHLERSKNSQMLHWDLIDIIDFWFWANRQLRKKNSFLSILSPNDKIFSQLPSFKGMRMVQDAGSKIQDA